MSLSPETTRAAAVPNGNSAVLRGDRAGGALAARFDVDLRQRDVVPAHLTDDLRAEAHAAGYAAGWAQGRRAAEEAARADAAAAAVRAGEAAAAQAAAVARAVAALGDAAANLERRAVPTAADLEDTIVASALAIAEAVLARELATATTPGADALARALDLAPRHRPVTVRLHPADLATITAAEPDSGAPREVDGRTVTLVADPALHPGDAVAHCDATTIDARLAPALERVREVLSR